MLIKMVQCTLNGDSDDMKHFMQNVLRYLSNDSWLPDAKASMTVGTNLETVYFKKHGPGYWEIVHAFGFPSGFRGYLG